MVTPRKLLPWALSPLLLGCDGGKATTSPESVGERPPPSSPTVAVAPDDWTTREPCSLARQPPAPEGDVSTLGMGRVPGGEVWLGVSEAELDKLVEVTHADGLDWSKADLGPLAPRRRATLEPYYLDLIPVSANAYAQCVESEGCTPPDLEECALSEFATWGHPELADHPINCVTWKQAMTYCATRQARLPTQDEWEFAARGEEGRLFPWGNTAASQTPETVGNFADRSFSESPEGEGLFPVLSIDDGFVRTSPVGAFPNGAGPFGHLDMAGQLGEMTDSPDPLESGCSQRGGSWSQPPTAASTVMTGDRYTAEVGGAYTTFRCAMTAPTTHSAS